MMSVCPAFGQTAVYWIGPSTMGDSGIWSAAGNWSPGVVPQNGGPTYDVYIDNGLSTGAVVTLDASHTISDLTVDATNSLLISNNTTLLVAGNGASGTITVNGTINLAASVNYTALEISAATVTLSGSGGLTLSNNADNEVYGASGSDLLVNQATIQGSGLFGAGQLTFSNSGTVTANQSVPLTLSTSGGTTNSGTLQATNGATLQIVNSTIANAGGMITAQNNSTVSLNGATVNGGTLSTAGSGVILQTGNSTLNGVTLAAGGSLQVANNTTLTASGSFTNYGTISLNSTSNYTNLIAASGGLTFTGGGSIILGSTGALSEIYGASGTTVITNADNTITGYGNIGAGQLDLVNQGTIDANVSGLTLVLQPSGSGFTNTGTMEATAGGTLELVGGTFTNTGATLSAGNGSTLELNGPTINGGSLSSTGTGLILQTGDSTLNGVTLAAGGSLQLANNTTLTASGSFTNNGTISLNSTTNYTNLVAASGGLTFTGGGNIILGSTGALSRIYGVSGTTVITNADNTISGEGNIGANQLELVNQSTIDADVSGQTLVLQPSGSGFTNTGTMEATGGGTLELDGGTFANSSGTLTAGSGSTMTLNGTTINGGNLSSAGSGVIVQAASSTLSGVTLEAGSTLQVPNNTVLSLSGSFTNSGAVTLNSTGNYTDIVATGSSLTLNGGGTITMGSGSAVNRIYGVSGSTVITNVDNTISGEGNIGAGQLVLDNGGVIDANVSGQTLVLQPSGSGFANTGTMEATGGATLEFDGGQYSNAGGIVSANATSTVLFSGGVFSGGVVTIGTSGTLELSNSASMTGETLNASTGASIQNLSGTNTLGGTVNMAAGSTVSLTNNSLLVLQSTGTYNNSGAISLNSTGNNTDLVMSGGTITLSGGGTVIMGFLTPYNRIYGVLGSETFVNADNTIMGSGTIGTGQLALFNNQGTVNADQTAYALNIDPSGSTTNSGTLEATAGATLAFNSRPVNNAGGTILAANGSTVQLSGSSVTGGTASIAGTGVLQLLAGATLTGGTVNTVSGSSIQNVNGTNTLGGIVNLVAGSNLVLDNNSVLELQSTGTFNNAGTISLDSTANNTDLAMSGGTVTLTGGGTVIMGFLTPYNRIYGVLGSETLVNANNTIKGSGTIGTGQLALFNNQGTVNADQTAYALNIDPSGSTTNSGIMEATSGATLIFAGSSVNNAGGTILAANGSFVDLNATTITGGTLSSSGTGVIVNSAGTVLNGIALSAGSVLQMPNSEYLTVSGTFANSGELMMDATVNLTDLSVAAGGLTLTGGGLISLSDSPYNRIYGPSGTTPLDNVNDTISGAGQIGVGQLTLTNTGSIVATGTNSLVIDVASPFTNQGSLIASGIGGIQFVAGNLTNSGTVAVQSGSVLAVTAGQYIQTGGTTSITSGTLNATSVSIQSGTLSASGTVGAALSNSGLLHPVQSLTLTGNLTLTGSSTILFDLGGSAPATGYDTLSAPIVTLGGSLDLYFTNGFQSTVLPSTTFTLIAASSSLSGQFAGISNGSIVDTTDGLGSFTINYLPTSLTLSNFTPVPEPSAASLMAVGAALLAAGRLAQRRSRLIPSR